MIGCPNHKAIWCISSLWPRDVVVGQTQSQPADRALRHTDLYRFPNGQCRYLWKLLTCSNDAQPLLDGTCQHFGSLLRTREIHAFSHRMVGVLGSLHTYERDTSICLITRTIFKDDKLHQRRLSRSMAGWQFLKNYRYHVSHVSKEEHHFPDALMHMYQHLFPLDIWKRRCRPLMFLP